MKNILLISLVLSFAFQPIYAQQDAEKQTLDGLRKQLVLVEEEEKQALKKQVEVVNSLLNNGVINKIEADKLKMKAAEARTRKIEERQKILLETIAYFEYNDNAPKIVNGAEIFLDIDSYFDKNDSLKPQPSLASKEPMLKRTPSTPQTSEIPSEMKLSNPTTVDLVFALGLNNTIKDGITWYNIEDEVDYSLYNSQFFEIGVALKTPLVKKNGLRLKYGLSFQSNILEPSRNSSFTEVNGQTLLEESTKYLGDSRFAVNNLVLPIHFEFGSTKERQNGTRRYYSTRNKLKIGIGGYAGINLSARQRVQIPFSYRNIRYLRDQIIDGYDVNKQIYGLSGYIGIGSFSIYGKYDLNTIFKNGAENEQFVSIGLRLDL
jgi:hypothetical protein